MAYATFGGAEPGEVLVTAERIESNSPARWHAEWTTTAERVLELADGAHDAGRERTARRAYFRAHTYFRTAEFFRQYEKADDEDRQDEMETKYELAREIITELEERGETEGTLVSLEPEAARQLTGFLNEYMKHGYHGSVAS